MQAFEELEDLLARHNICIAVKEKLVKDSGVADEIAYDNIVQKLLTKPRARGKFFGLFFPPPTLFYVKIVFRNDKQHARKNECLQNELKCLWMQLLANLLNFKYLLLYRQQELLSAVNKFLVCFEICKKRLKHLIAGWHANLIESYFFFFWKKDYKQTN